MIADRTFNENFVWAVMTHPEMWATVAEDGQTKNDYRPDVENEAWIAIHDTKAFYGLYRVHAQNSVTCEIHAQVLPEWRQTDEGFQTGRLALEWIRDNTEYQKVICWVPSIYPNVRSFAERHGFVLEGTSRNSYVKNDEVVDQWLLGITRKEIG